MNDSDTFFIILAILILVVILLSKSGKSVATKTETVNIDYNSNQGQIFNRFFPTISEIIFSFSLSVPPELVLAVINQESNLRFKTQKNYQVIGDDGTSLGYMQVSNNAVKDVNSFYHNNYSFSDLKDERKNLEVGIKYLNICYNSAVKLNSPNPIKLALKKYNGGNDETDSSKNSMAEKYSLSAFNYYKIFKGMV